MPKFDAVAVDDNVRYIFSYGVGHLTNVFDFDVTVEYSFNHAVAFKLGISDDLTDVDGVCLQFSISVLHALDFVFFDDVRVELRLSHVVKLADV